MRYWLAAGSSRALTRRLPRHSPRRWRRSRSARATSSSMRARRVTAFTSFSPARSSLVAGPRTATATAVDGTGLARLKEAALGPGVDNRPEIAEQLVRVVGRRLRRTNDALADLIFTDVPGRVAKNLLQMAGRFGTRDG